MEKQLICSLCSHIFREKRVPSFRLEEDLFFKYTCALCSSTKQASLQRIPLSWPQIVHLILFNLHNKHTRPYFRWREDICAMIDEHWSYLCPGRQRSASWPNSVSSVLSANPTLFQSGFNVMNEPGWWGLKQIKPPHPNSTNDASAMNNGGKCNADSAGNDLNAGGYKLKRPAAPPSHPSSHSAARAGKPLPSQKDHRETEFAKQASAAPSQKGPANREALNLVERITSNIPNVQALLPMQMNISSSTMQAAHEIKRKLVERLLKVDSRILKEALTANNTNALLQMMSRLEGGNCSANNNASGHNGGKSNANGKHERHKSSSPAIKTTIHSHLHHLSSSNASSVPGALLPFKRQHPKPSNFIRASPSENDVLEKCLRIVNPSTTIKQLKRKLIVRRMKRRLGTQSFDIDNFMYLYLKEMCALAHPKKAKIAKAALGQNSEGEGEDSAHQETNETYFNIPYHQDPTLSFRAKLVGSLEVTKNLPFISPFTGLLLPQPIAVEENAIPPKLAIFQEMYRKKRLLANTCAPKSSDVASTEANKAPLILPLAIEYHHFRREYLGQVERLLSTLFWPNVDLREAVEYPDFGLLAIYRGLVVGCALCTPEGYLTYFCIHPDWRGIGRHLLSHLITTVLVNKKLDITLHVSVDNPALILYQSLGFKAEEFIVDFYDKYYKMDERTVGIVQRYKKNAFLMRLRHVIHVKNTC